MQGFVKPLEKNVVLEDAKHDFAEENKEQLQALIGDRALRQRKRSEFIDLAGEWRKFGTAPFIAAWISNKNYLTIL